MASAVARRIVSPSSQRPSSAAKKGEAPSMNVAFATEVWCKRQDERDEAAGERDGGGERHSRRRRGTRRSGGRGGAAR